MLNKWRLWVFLLFLGLLTFGLMPYQASADSANFYNAIASFGGGSY